MITTIQGDMLAQDPAVEDGSIDLVLTDPPYNISGDGAKPVWIDKATGENKSTSTIKSSAKALLKIGMM